MTFGGQTVGFVSITKPGTIGAYGLPAKARSVTLLPGCHFRTLSTAETPDTETNVATEFRKLTADPEAVALAAKSTGELLYDGTDSPEDVEANRFQIVGPLQPKYDGDSVHHVTVVCKRQFG